MEISLFGTEVDEMLAKPEVTARVQTTRTPRTPRAKTPKAKVHTISSLNWDIQKEYDKNIRTTHNDNRNWESREFDLDIMKDDLRDYVFLCDNDGTRYRERIWDKIKEFGVVKWFEAKGFPINDNSVWCNRYTGSETTLAEEIIGYNNAFRNEDTLEEQGYLLWENYCPKEIFDKCELTETREIKELKAKRSELREPQQANLNKWKEFIVNLCKEKGQEIEKIWFDTSVPYENEICVRLDGHRCWSQCVSFRFQNNKLKAYDSHFGGGTSMFYGQEDEDDEKKIREVMERVFNKECSDSSWEDNHDEREVKKREIEIDEDGWINK